MVFYLAFCKSIDFGWETHCSLQGGLVVVFSLGSSPTVDTANRAKRLQPNLNMSGPVPVYVQWDLRNAK